MGTRFEEQYEMKKPDSRIINGKERWKKSVFIKI